MTYAIQKAREALRAIIDTLDAEEMGEGPPATGHVAHWQKLHDDGTAALAALDAETPAAPADVGEEPVAHTTQAEMEDIGRDVVGRVWKNSTRLRSIPLYSATALERVVRERDEALRWAGCWHRICQTIATVLELPEPEADTFAASVRDKMSDAEAKLAEARKVIEPFAMASEWLRNEAPDESFADNAVVHILATHIHAARHFLEETK